jgi:threonine/homoserine/homoserine lactone efflux protein
MGEAAGQVISFGVGVALSPIPIIGVVLMLATPRARSNGLAFVFGWVVGLSTVGALSLIVLDGAGAGENGQPADWAGVLKLVLGLMLVLLAVKQWRGRPGAGEEAELPAWMHKVDAFRAGKATGLAVLLSAVNPKNLLLVIGAATAISQTGVPAGSQAIALAVFVFIGTLGPGAPVAIYFAMGDRSRAILDDLRTWMSQNNSAIMAVICLVIAAKLIGDGISVLSS